MLNKHFNSFVMSILTAVAVWVGNSVVELNKNVATILERTVSHEKRLNKLENRTEKILEARRIQRKNLLGKS